jgi:hypothetical protein
MQNGRVVMKQLTYLHPVVGKLRATTGDLVHLGAEFLIRLNELDREAYEDLRPRINVERFDAALRVIEGFLGEVDAALGFDDLLSRG